MSISDNDKAAVRTLCNEVTYMMFDLENGNHIKPNGDDVVIDEMWSFKYIAKLLSETIEETPRGPVKTIVKTFTISVSHGERIIFDFDFNQQTRNLTIRTIDAFYVSMFLDILDAYRRKMFNVPE